MKKLQWLTCDADWQSPVFRKAFTLSKAPSAAKLKICGLGFFEAYINGRRVSADYFQPVWSDYQKRDLSSLLYPMPGASFTHRVYYLVYDVAKYLRPGKNVIAVMLGNGWYRQTVRNAEGKLSYGDELKLAFELSYTGADGKKAAVTSGADMKCRQGHIIFNNIYYGEKHDYNLFEQFFETDYNDAAWERARLTAPPDAVFTRQDCPPDRVIRSVKPELLYDFGGRKIYDAGENISGWAAVRGQGDITVRYAELLKDGAELDFRTAGDNDFPQQIQTDAYLNVKHNMTLHPVFHWNAFRYFEVSGRVSDVRVDVVHADVKVMKEYKGDSPALQWLYGAFVRTQLSNMHCGVPSDCPHREKLGYTGDGQLACDTAMTILDCKKFYKKWIQDILDCQDRKTGHVRHTAPFYGGGGGPCGWGGAAVIVPYMYHKHYGGKELLARCWPHMLRWFKCMRGFSENGLIVREIEGGWCLGDWCTPGKVLLPVPFVNTYYYIKCMRYAVEIGGVLGRSAGLEKYIAESECAFKAAYYDEKTQSFCGGVQGADAFGADLGLGGEKTLGNLLSKYRGADCLDTGIFGTDILFNVLAANGEKDLILKLLSLAKYPSFGFWKESGATTLWECWDGGSRSHPMFGACVKHLL